MDKYIVRIVTFKDGETIELNRKTNNIHGMSSAIDMSVSVLPASFTFDHIMKITIERTDVKGWVNHDYDMTAGQKAVADLHAQIRSEVARCQMLEKEYRALGPVGRLGLVYITSGLGYAQDAKDSTDIAVLERVLRDLKTLD